jgi:hypothetical protein
VNGLDLETFLLLLRADLGAWATLGVAGVGLALLVWSSWRSRRGLRRCLALSLAAHLGLVIYGSTVPAVRKAVRGGVADPSDREHIRRIRVAPLVESGQATPRAMRADGASGTGGASLELAGTPPALADPPLRVARPPADDGGAKGPDPAPLPGSTVAMDVATPRPARPAPATGARPESDSRAGAPPPPPAATPTDRAELDRMTAAIPRPPAGPEERSTEAGARSVIDRAVGAPDLALRTDVRLRPGRADQIPSRGDRPSTSSATPAGRGDEAAESAAPTSQPIGGGSPEVGVRIGGASPTGGGPLAMEDVTPPSRRARSGGSGLADLGERPAIRAPTEVPKVYRPRVEPDRSARARLAGASAASELAVERALDWLARHQDRDGRWNAAVARYDDGAPVPGDRDFTAHCPADEVCSGACAYWEADTALTGLALLTYLGAGYTQLQGKYAETVDRGLTFLIGQQKPDGDLRGVSVVVGMYGHAMATLALCEGYALTGDSRLRQPAVRAVAFLVRSRARDRQAWRYRPGEIIGDTSILGWVIMGLKSARESGLPIPEEDSVRRGVLAWLDRVSSGEAGGLACYQPAEPVTPTMTAEAWVCRQFLDVGGPGPASGEAAEFLLRNPTDRGQTNYYYWYYATLALYQHGGDPWTRWNAAIRDRIVRLQHASGHRAGSWDPDDSLYGAKGGRVYSTALAALTLEVYYRYLRLYDEPKLPVEADEAPALTAPRREP